MTLEQNSYGSERLDVRRPPLFVTAVNIAGGGLLTVLAFLSLPYNYSTLASSVSSSDLLRGLSHLSGFDRVGLVTLAYSLAIVAFALFFVPSILSVGVGGLMLVWKGLVLVMKRPKPARVPADFRDSTDVFHALEKRAIPVYSRTYDQLGTKAQSDFIAVLLGGNARFIAPTHRAIVSENAGRLRARILAFLMGAGLLGLLIWLTQWLSTESAGGILRGRVAFAISALLTKETAQQLIRAPFIWLIALQAAIAIVEYLSSTGLVPRMEPLTASLEASDYYRGFGHPVQLLSRLCDSAKPLELQPFPNRYEEVPLSTDTSVGVADTATFQCAFFAEQQPRPIPSEKDPVGYLLLATGWLLRLAGFYGVLFLLLPSPVRDFFAGSGEDSFLWAPLFVTVAGIASLSALQAGGKFLHQASALFESVRFQSEAIFVRFIGNLTRSGVKVGKAMTDSIESENVAVRSDFTARLYAAELSSEAATLTAPRELLALRASSASEEWLRHFRISISQLRDEGVRPIGLDLQAPEVSGITQANIAMSSLRAIATEQRKIEAQLEGHEAPLLGPRSPAGVKSIGPGVDTAPLADGEWKECPDCAERVRIRARKCRFCGHQFEDVQGSDAAPMDASVGGADSSPE